MIGSTVPFSKTYTSNVSLADAQAQADGDAGFAAEGQAYANANGVCSVAVNYSVSYGLNPITQNALIFMRNGVEVHRTGSEGAGLLEDIFFPGDTMKVRAFSYGPAYPWEAGSKANLSISQGGVSLYNADESVQDIELQDFEFVVGAGAINVVGTGSSTAVGYVTKVANVVSNTTQVKLTVTDTTAPKSVLILDNAIQNSGSTQVFPFNYFGDGNTLTARVENQSTVSPMNVTVNGGGVVAIAASSFHDFTGIAKDSINVTVVQ